MPKVRERRTGEVVVGQGLEQSIDRVRPSGESRSDHFDRPLWPDEVRRPRQVEPPLQTRSACGPQANASVLTDNDSCDVLVGHVGNRDQALPAAPAGRRGGLCAEEVANHRVQAVRADQKVSFSEAAVVEINPYPVV